METSRPERYLSYKSPNGHFYTQVLQTWTLSSRRAWEMKTFILLMSDSLQRKPNAVSITSSPLETFPYVNPPSDWQNRTCWRPLAFSCSEQDRTLCCVNPAAHVPRANQTSCVVFIWTSQMILLFLSGGMLRLNDSTRKTAGLGRRLRLILCRWGNMVGELDLGARLQRKRRGRG